MANAKKCDKCGRLYELEPGAKPRVNLYENYVSESGANRTKSYDVCDECADEVLRFVAGE